MTTIIAANNAGSSLAAPITSAATTLTVAAGTGAIFPQPGAGQIFKLTVADAATGLLREIMHVTGVSGDTFTVVRGQENTTARAYQLGDPCANLYTAGTLASVAQTANLGSAAYLNASDQLGGVAAIQPFAGGNPNGFVAGNAATTNLPPSMVWDESNQIFWVCVSSGNAASAVWISENSNAGTVYCGTSTGTPNAQTLTPTVPVTNYANGLSIAWVSGFTNTGAVTLNVSGKGVKNLYKPGPSGPIPLAAGDLVTGNMYSARFDGTEFQLTATELGTASEKNVGNSVNDPGTGALEVFEPFKAAVVGATRAYVAADLDFTYKRSNAGAGMTDTLPAIGTLFNGWKTTIINTDSSATLVVGVPAGVTLNGVVNGSLSIAPGNRTAKFGCDGTGFWVTQAPLSNVTASQAAYISVANNGQTISPGIYQVDSSGGAFTVFLELSPTIGDNYTFSDFSNSWGTFPVTLNGNGTSIGAAGTFLLDATGWTANFEFSTIWNMQ